MTRLFSILFLTGILAACSARTGMQAQDKDLLIQAMPLPVKEEDNGTEYRVRIFPSKELMSAKGASASRQMNYQMDSCFYIREGQTKYYPGMVQAVANGVAGSYEYLVVFDGQQDGAKPGKLVYQDKYLNGKSYTLESSSKSE